LERNQALYILKAISQFYHHFTVDKEKIDMWAGMLMNYEYQLVMNNLKEFVPNSKFPPTIADLVERKETDKRLQYRGFEQIEKEKLEADKLIEMIGDDGVLRLPK
jgi:hypothetical protein